MADSFNYLGLDGDEQICTYIYKCLEDYEQPQFQNYHQLDSPLLYSFSSQKQENSDMRNQIQNESTMKTNIQPIEVSTQPNRNNSKKRVDGKSKNFQQNLASYCMTNTPKIISLRLKAKKPSKKDIKDIKLKLETFLDENKVKNSQLIILFIYLFFKLESAEESQFIKMKQQLLSYLDKRDKEANAQSLQEREKLKKKVQINRTIVEKYFSDPKQELESQWIKEICGQLFTGRQKQTIEKPVNRLIVLQEDMNKLSNQKSQDIYIQSFLE